MKLPPTQADVIRKMRDGKYLFARTKNGRPRKAWIAELDERFSSDMVPYHEAQLLFEWRIVRPDCGTREGNIDGDHYETARFALTELGRTVEID